MANTIGFIEDLTVWLRDDDFRDWGTVHLEDEADNRRGSYVITLNYEKNDATIYKIVYCYNGTTQEVTAIDGLLDHTLLIKTFSELMREARMIRSNKERGADDRSEPINYAGSMSGY